MYVKREYIKEFSLYISNHQDQTGDLGLNAQCRANYLTLQSYFLDLLIWLCDSSPNRSFAVGKELLSKCQEMCSNLLPGLCQIRDPWSIINNSVEGDFGSLERTVGQVATVGVMASRCQMKNIEDIMLATLVCNIGLINLPYNLCKAQKTILLIA